MTLSPRSFIAALGTLWVPLLLACGVCVGTAIVLTERNVKQFERYVAYQGDWFGRNWVVQFRNGGGEPGWLSVQLDVLAVQNVGSDPDEDAAVMAKRLGIRPNAYTHVRSVNSGRVNIVMRELPSVRVPVLGQQLLGFEDWYSRGMRIERYANPGWSHHYALGFSLAVVPLLLACGTAAVAAVSKRFRRGLLWWVAWVPLRRRGGRGFEVPGGHP